ncbi:kinase-like domain-containing protein [Mycena filopes]|nr:kinase-like domain-containing protein [Mycena filopes]
MSTPHLSVFRKDTEAFALALSKPATGIWTPVSEQVISDELFRVSVNSASIAFLVGEQPHAVGTGAAICLSCEFNQDVADCPENTAIANWASLPITLLKDIADYLQPAPGDLIRCRFRTLPDGGFEIFNATRADLLPDTPIPGSAPFPTVSAQELYRTFTGPPVSDVRLHLVSIGASGEQLFYKTTRYYAAELLEDARFMASLPHSDFVLRPVYTVINAAGHFQGLLMPFAPASSLEHVLGATRAFPLTWDLKVAWCVDAAAALAWLPTQTSAWGDLKLENIVLCPDGHCRLIDYSPTERFTEDYWAPEKTRSAASDVFALGIVLWAIASDASAPASHPLGLSVDSGAPLWFSGLVSRCFSHTAATRPTAMEVYDTLHKHS